MTPTLTVVTPWHNHPELIGNYWDAIRLAAPEGCVVIDNGSHPPLVQYATWPVTRDYHRRYQVIRNETNRGFSRACNQGLDEVRTDAVLFLNNDVIPTRPDWASYLIHELRPGRLVGADLRVSAHTAVDGKSVPYLDGWCLAGMTDEIRGLGGWDEDFEEPSYFGDNDLCVRATQAGMRLVQTDVGLRHISNATSRDVEVSGVSRRNFERYAARVREARAA